MTGTETNKSFLRYECSRPESMLVDDETAADLELDEVFMGLDRTLTTPGQSVLYALMRSTLSSKAAFR